MGGKRPDQYAIDPGEANATDYKDRRKEDFIPEEKEHVVDSAKQREQHESHIPKSGVNPALAELRAARARQASESGDGASDSADAEGTE